MLYNPLILILHVALICGLLLFALRFGKEMLVAWLCLLAVAMNLFVLKQITLMGLNVTSSDALAVGYLLGLNLIQEFFGRDMARRTVWISFFTACGFVILSQIQLAYIPNTFDTTHAHFTSLFSPMPRLFIASLTSFLIVQFVDIAFFGFLRTQLRGRYLIARTLSTLILSQLLDTLLFSFLGLYGLVASLGHIILVSLAIKGVIILLTTPFIALSKKVVLHDVQV